MSDSRTCAACKRPLKHPSQSGLGPVCARRLGIPVDRPSRLRQLPRPIDAPPEVHPDQTALPLIPFQPTLESL